MCVKGGGYSPHRPRDSQAVYFIGTSVFSRTVFILWHRPAILEHKRSVRHTAQTYNSPLQYPQYCQEIPGPKVTKEVQAPLGPITLLAGLLSHVLKSPDTHSGSVLCHVTFWPHPDSPLLTPSENLSYLVCRHRLKQILPS